jgi:hypothetical protein
MFRGRSLSSGLKGPDDFQRKDPRSRHRPADMAQTPFISR